jgi:uncharacterized protein (TIGR04255 family)
MAEPRRLARPPIVEALVDIRVSFPAEPAPEQFGPLRTALGTEYPEIDERREMRAEFRVEGGKVVAPETHDLGFSGLFFRAPDKTRLAQLRRDGFTFNQLAPYTSGEAVLTEALRLWELYRKTLAPSTIDRVALRYINRLNLPFREGDEFKRFLNSPPELPEPAPQNVSEFLSRVVAFDRLAQASAIVIQKLDAGAPGQSTAVILDVDVFKLVSLDPSSELRPLLETLRELKNRTFFALLTNEALESYL